MLLQKFLSLFIQDWKMQQGLLKTWHCRRQKRGQRPPARDRRLQRGRFRGPHAPEAISRTRRFAYSLCFGSRPLIAIRGYVQITFTISRKPGNGTSILDSSQQDVASNFSLFTQYGFKGQRMTVPHVLACTSCASSECYLHPVKQCPKAARVQLLAYIPTRSLLHNQIRLFQNLISDEEKASRQATLKIWAKGLDHHGLQGYDSHQDYCNYSVISTYVDPRNNSATLTEATCNKEMHY